MAIPKPTLVRLCQLERVLTKAEEKGEILLSSKAAGERLGAGAPTIRKDLTYIGEVGNAGSGYFVTSLKTEIRKQLQLEREKNACIIGLGFLGLAFLQNPNYNLNAINLVAAFDANVNRLETIQTSVPLFPTYEIKNIIKRKNIELAILTVSGEEIKTYADLLIANGIKGILNFSDVILPEQPAKGTFVRNVDVITELKILTALNSTFIDIKK